MAMASSWGARHAVCRYESVTTMAKRNNIVAQQAFAAQPSQSELRRCAGSATVRLIALEEWDALAGEGIWSHAQTPAGQVGEQRRLWKYTDRFLRDGVEGKNEEQERKIVRRVLMPKIAKPVSIVRM